MGQISSVVMVSRSAGPLIEETEMLTWMTEEVGGGRKGNRVGDHVEQGKRCRWSTQPPYSKYPYFTSKKLHICALSTEKIEARRSQVDG